MRSARPARRRPRGGAPRGGDHARSAGTPGVAPPRAGRGSPARRDRRRGCATAPRRSRAGRARRRRATARTRPP